MVRKIIKYKSPIKRPTGKLGPLAWQQAARDKKDKEKEDFKKLESELEKNSQRHFRYFIGTTAAIGAGNILEYTPPLMNEVQMKAVISLIALGVLTKANDIFYKKDEKIKGEMEKLQAGSTNIHRNVFNHRSANITIFATMLIATSFYAYGNKESIKEIIEKITNQFLSDLENTNNHGDGLSYHPTLDK
ncbi:MAG: hypothetical protein R3D88_00970 [Alphaproteobacteria bacterium]|nr:hypothetical protein [Alphaproteobacteria bacterium]